MMDTQTAYPNTEIDTHVFDLNGHEVKMYRYWNVSIEAGQPAFAIVHSYRGTQRRLTADTMEDARAIFGSEVKRGELLRAVKSGNMTDEQIVMAIRPIVKSGIGQAIKADFVTMCNRRKDKRIDWTDEITFLNNRIHRMIATAI